MRKRNIIVIGASAGGVIALVDLFKSLPDDFEAYVFIVLHVSPFSPSLLPSIISRSCRFEAQHPQDGEDMVLNRVYIAPPDHHLLIEKDRIIVKKGPKENRFRPSIDALFRSAAYNYNTRVIGLVLSGLLDDGTSGLWMIKRQGGLSIIQDPNDAQFPSMPLNVMEYVDVDYTVPVKEMGALLGRLIKEEAPTSPLLPEAEIQRLQMEIDIAARDNSFKMDVLDKGELTPFTCPECNGTLARFSEGKIVRFRCHTGHAFTSSSLLADVTKSIEENLWKTVRGLEEAIMLLEQVGKQFDDDGKTEVADLFYQKARRLLKRSEVLRLYIFEQEQFSEDMRFKEVANAKNEGNGTPPAPKEEYQHGQ